MIQEVLRSQIDSILDGVVDRDYVFLDLPYHGNIGDSFIYAGVMDYLSSLSHKCLYLTSENSFDERMISRDTMILFNGGGNFGDLWPDCTEFRNRIIQSYPDNKILIFSQSVCYKEDNNLKADQELYSRCRNLTLCARDKASFDFFRKHFSNNHVLLVPDMAFHMTVKKKICREKRSDRVLFIRRNDRETEPGLFEGVIPESAEVKDWPTISTNKGPYKRWRIYGGLLRHLLSQKAFRHFQDWYWQKMILPYNVRTGLKCINRYDTIYTTRLHAAIAGVMLGIKVIAFDNSYKKVSSFADTWLKDVPDFTVVK